MQAKFLYRIKELIEILQKAPSIVPPPQSLLAYLNKELLMRPSEQTLWNYELNRIKYTDDLGKYLDRKVTSTKELTMLTGLMVVAKFMIVKMFLRS